MIRRLKRRFMITCMASLLAVLMVVLCTINGLFWKNSIDMADDLLSYLALNDGDFRPFPEDSGPGAEDGNADKPGPEKPEKKRPDENESLVPHEPESLSSRLSRLARGFRMNKETSFRTRCFSVLFDAQGNVDTVRTDRIAAVSREDAVDYARSVLERGHSRGFSGIYRYYREKRENGVFIAFLDCNDSLYSFRMLSVISLAILLFCLAAMFVLLLFFSGPAIYPVAESFEKQKQFIADAGHELKTPLTIIKANAAVLEMTGDKNEWVESIQNQTRRLDGLVQELLTLSRVESDVPLVFNDFSISNAAEDTVSAFEAIAKSHGKCLQAAIEQELECHGDEESIRRLISILLDNACKYALEGSNIAFSLKKAGRSLIIETRNPCVSMDKRHLDKLFERFYRADAARSRETGGYGIGLSIAREIAQKHKGKIRASCPVQEEIVFTVTLPQ